ncbi:Uncharacterised protein [Bordetella pertussis]|nr:Uncharacterised protein [Bordetella pertussis]CFP61280.1 Uncharacterised protein [Bordetella pertussis]
MAPMVRLRLRTGTMNETFSPRSSAGLLRSISWWSSAPARPWSCSSVWRTSASETIRWNTREKSRPCAFQCSTLARMSSRSVRPIRSSNLRMPSWAMISRTSSATKKK